MSHYSTFDASFKDKQLLFKAMKKLDMHPENMVWESYKSVLGKLTGLNGIPIGRLLTGEYGEAHIFFTEDNGEYVLNVEAHKLDESERITTGNLIKKLIVSEYMKCTVEKLQSVLVRSGLSSRIIEGKNDTAETYTLEIGDYSKRIIVSIASDGKVNEKVEGVSGRSCLDLTSMIEQITANHVEREWLPEYSEVVEDQVIQVLRLS
jgi:hypothetical protein